MNRFAKLALIGATVIGITASTTAAFAHGGGRGHGGCDGMRMGWTDGMGPGGAKIDKQLTVDDVRAIVAGRLAMRGNKRLKVGNVQEKDADTVIAEIVTVDNSLVNRFAVNRHTGRFAPAE